MSTEKRLVTDDELNDLVNEKIDFLLDAIVDDSMFMAETLVKTSSVYTTLSAIEEYDESAVQFILEWVSDTKEPHEVNDDWLTKDDVKKSEPDYYYDIDYLYEWSSDMWRNSWEESHWEYVISGDADEHLEDEDYYYLDDKTCIDDLSDKAKEKIEMLGYIPRPKMSCTHPPKELYLQDKLDQMKKLLGEL